MRDDSGLYTGTSSASISREQPLRIASREKKQEKRLQLKPAGQIVHDQIQKEIDALRNIDYLNIEEMLTDEHFKSELMARKKTIERLTAVQARLNNILRERPVKEAPDSFDE